jgi:hypothetical protein
VRLDGAHCPGRFGPLGENPAGTFRFDFSGPDIGDGSVAGEVSCLQVTGNRASVGGPVTSASGDFSVFMGGAVTFTVADNSPSTPVPDAISAFSAYVAAAGPPPPAGTPGCLAPQGTQFAVTGDISVQDDTVGGGSLPAAKQQCSDGGFSQFGVFKNQGDCVAFVATQGSNEPGKNMATPRKP